MTGTYLTLSLSEIGQTIDISDEGAVRALIVNMVCILSLSALLTYESMLQIQDEEIAGSISADGTVTFEDSIPRFNKARVDELLAATQRHGAALAELDRKVASSKEFLSKVRVPSLGFYGLADLCIGNEKQRSG